MNEDSSTDKSKWMKVAEIFDAFRLIPRILLLAAYSFVAIYTYEFTEFYFALIASDEVNEMKLAAISAFGGLTIPALSALATGLSKSYLDSGRTWERGGNGNG